MFSNFNLVLNTYTIGLGFLFIGLIDLFIGSAAGLFTIGISILLYPITLFTGVDTSDVLFIQKEDNPKLYWLIVVIEIMIGAGLVFLLNPNNRFFSINFL